MKKVLVATIASVAALLTSPTPAFAHGDAPAGESTKLTIGWVNEPAYAGYPNGVFVHVEHDGEPRSDAKLSVVVIYGDKNSETRSEAMPLDPAFGAPGDYHADLIPTASGRYTFLITGRVAEDRVNVTMTSGDRTFDGIQEPTGAQFPEQVPGGTEQRDAIEALQEASAGSRSAADAAAAAADSAKTSAMIGIGVGALALLLALGGLLRRGSRG